MLQISPAQQLVLLIITTSVVLLVDAAVNELHGTAVFYASLIRELVEADDLLHIFRGERAYLLKPPLVLWLSTISAEWFGLNNFGVSLVSRLAGIACVVLVYAITRLLWDHRVAWLAAIILLTNSTFLQFSASLRMDSLLLCGGLLSVFCWLERERGWAQAGIFVGITLGVLSKGPLGFAPLVLIGAHAIVHRLPLWRLIKWRWAWLLAPIALWYGYLYGLHGSRPFLELGADTIKASGLTDMGAWQTGLAEYVFKPARRYWPWLPFIVLGFIVACRRAASRRADAVARANHLWLIIWFGIVVLAALAKPDKDIRYLYSGLPALAIFGAFGVLLVLKQRLPNGLVVGVSAAIMVLAVYFTFASGARDDTRPMIAALKARLEQTEKPLVAIGGYPVDLTGPRRQNTHRDWIFFYLGREPAVYSWAQIKPADLAAGDGVFLTHSRGYRQRLQEYGLQAKYTTTEMIYAVKQ